MPVLHNNKCPRSPLSWRSGPGGGPTSTITKRQALMANRTDQPPEQPTPRTCTGCGGNGGRTEDTSSNGITRQNWVSCGSCGGSGEAR